MFFLFLLLCSWYNPDAHILSIVKDSHGMDKEKAAQARIKYAKNHLKRIPLDVSKEKYTEIKEAADKQNESVNGFIKTAIDRRIKSGD